MTREEAKSCIGTIEMLQRLAYNIHGVMDVVDADNCKKIIKALEQEPVIDKIRAEIEELRFGQPLRKYVVDACLEIIDKYKESEGKDFEAKDIAIKALEQEQKTGRWFLSGGYWRCSECKEKALLKLDKSMGGCKEYMPIKSKYCYNCGAKMQEE